jgi:hypothetical protein
VKIGNENIYFSKTPGTHVIVASYNPSDKKRKIYTDRVQEKLRKFLPTESEIKPEYVEFVIEPDLGCCLERLRHRVKEIL